jgi:mannose-6-phosphate isomerase-like protein (cupin superfamily)
MKRTVPVLGALLCLIGLLTGVPARAESEEPVVDLWLAGQRITASQEALIADTALAPDQDVRVREVGRDTQTSHHVVGIRTGEALHRHDRHDLVVVVMRGQGTMRLGAETRPVAQGSILYVPRGRIHAFTNTAGEDSPSFAYVIYSPPFDGQDRVPVAAEPRP